MLKERALAAEDAARAVAGVTNSEGGGASANRSVVALATSHGFAGSYAATSYGVSASVLAGTGGGMERDYAHHATRHFDRLEDPAEIGRRAEPARWRGSIPGGSRRGRCRWCTIRGSGRRCSGT